MKQLFSGLVVLLGAAALVIYFLDSLSNSRASEFRAQAVLVNAQSSARQDLLTGMMPYVVLGLGVLVLAVVLVLAILAIVTGAVAAMGINEYGRVQRAEQRETIKQTRALLARPDQPIIINLTIEGRGTTRHQQYKTLSTGFIIDQR